MQPFIVIGDKTSHGGTVVGGAPTASTMNKQIARVGDKVTCPKCGNNTIATGDSSMIVMGQPVARQGDKTACGATLISSQSVTLGEHSSGGSGGLGGSNASKPPYDQQFQLLDKSGNPVANANYKITSPSGVEVTGVTDSNGKTSRVVTDSAENLNVYLVS